MTLEKRQFDILVALKVLWKNGNHSATRKDMGAETGFDKGYSKALGPHHREGGFPPESLQGRNLVKCTNPKDFKDYEYVITPAGLAALKK